MLLGVIADGCGKYKCFELANCSNTLICAKVCGVKHVWQFVPLLSDDVINDYHFVSVSGLSFVKQQQNEIMDPNKAKIIR